MFNICTTMKIIIPAYIYPEPASEWDTILKSDSSIVSDVIFNPNSGPSNQIVADYVEIVSRLKKKNIGTMGYVATTYGKKPMAETLDEVKKYFEWYSVDGIFFDEAASGEENLPYYKELYQEVKGKVVLNHGVVPHEGYMQVSDVMVIFESGRDKHITEIFPAWLKKYPKNKIYQIIHSCKSTQMKAALTKCNSTSGYTYITDGSYSVLPTYWKSLMANVKILV